MVFETSSVGQATKTSYFKTKLTQAGYREFSGIINVLLLKVQDLSTYLESFHQSTKLLLSVITRESERHHLKKYMQRWLSKFAGYRDHAYFLNEGIISRTYQLDETQLLNRDDYAATETIRAGFQRTTVCVVSVTSTVELYSLKRKQVCNPRIRYTFFLTQNPLHFTQIKINTDINVSIISYIAKQLKDIIFSIELDFAEVITACNIHLGETSFEQRPGEYKIEIEGKRNFTFFDRFLYSTQALLFESTIDMEEVNEMATGSTSIAVTEAIEGSSGSSSSTSMVVTEGCELVPDSASPSHSVAAASQSSQFSERTRAASTMIALLNAPPPSDNDLEEEFQDIDAPPPLLDLVTMNMVKSTNPAEYYTDDGSDSDDDDKQSHGGVRLITDDINAAEMADSAVPMAVVSSDGVVDDAAIIVAASNELSLVDDDEAFKADLEKMFVDIREAISTEISADWAFTKTIRNWLGNSFRYRSVLQLTFYSKQFVKKTSQVTSELSKLLVYLGK